MGQGTVRKPGGWGGVTERKVKGDEDREVGMQAGETMPVL